MLHRGALAARGRARPAGRPGVALASPQFAATLVLTYSSQVPGSPRDLTASQLSAIRARPPGSRRSLVKIRVGFHPGTRIDTTALPRCRASDTDVRILGLRACPAPTSSESSMHRA